MLSFSGSLKVFVAVEACDMRKGFNGLHALVTERLGEDLQQGALFVFSNRRHTRIQSANPRGHARSLVQISPNIAATGRIIKVVAEYVSHLRSHCSCSVKMVLGVTHAFR